MARIIYIVYRSIRTIRKHIMPEDALAGGCEVVRIDETAEFGVIIAGL